MTPYWGENLDDAARVAVAVVIILAGSFVFCLLAAVLCAALGLP